MRVKAGETYCREVAECEDGEEGGLAACTVADDDELPVFMLAVVPQA